MGTFSASKNLEIFSFLNISVYKYVLCGTYMLCRIVEILGNLYTKGIYFQI